MLDVAGEYMEGVLGAPAERASVGSVVGSVAAICWTIIGVVLLIEVL